MLNILRELLVDVFILVACLSLGNMLARDRITTVNFKNGMILGALCGALGCLLMIYGVRLAPNLLVDFRSIPIIIMGIYSTFSSVILTSLIIGVFRIVFLGWSFPAVASLIIALLMGFTCALIGQSQLKQNNKWILSIVATCLISSLGFVVVIQDQSILRDVISAHLAGMIIISVTTYLLKNYIHKANERYYFLKDSSNTDFLTGLYNVRYFDKSLNDIMARAKDRNESISLLFIDVDHFKNINDTYGHINGDVVLRELGDILRKQSRSNDIVTRNGGEEFTLLLKNCGLLEATNVAERIRTATEQHRFYTRNKDVIRITLSIGVSCYPETTKSEEKLIEQADIALYAAKRNGRNRVCVATLSADIGNKPEVSSNPERR